MLKSSRSKFQVTRASQAGLLLIALVTLGSTKEAQVNQAESDVRLLVDAKAKLGEGSLWDSKRQVLYWVDIEGYKVHIYDPAKDEDKEIEVGEQVGTVVFDEEGKLIVALRKTIERLDPETGKRKVLAHADQEPEKTRFNDGKCDPQGRFWVGTMGSENGYGIGALYRFGADHKLVRMLDEISTSNGLVWRDKTFFYIDTPTGEVRAFPYDPASGDIGKGKAVVKVQEGQGHPDGMALDAEGKVWVAHWGGSGVYRWDPDTGELLRKVRVPASRVTSCAFGGPNLDKLYITTASIGMNDGEWKETPHAGGLFVLDDPGVKGLEATAYKD